MDINQIQVLPQQNIKQESLLIVTLMFEIPFYSSTTEAIPVKEMGSDRHASGSGI